MKTLLAYAFVVSTLFPPGGFVCIEASGDVQIEYGHTGCDTGETSRSLEFAADSDTGCVGCSDIIIPASSVFAKRLLFHAATPAVAPMLMTPEDHDAGDALPYVVGSISSSSHLRHMSSTVIRR